MGVRIGFNNNMFSLLNCCAVFSRICIVVHNKSLGVTFTVLNFCGPYKGKKSYWDRLISMQCLKVNTLILGGDLNLKVSSDEIWGFVMQDHQLAPYFLDRFEVVSWDKWINS